MNYFRNLIICKDCSNKLDREVRYNKKANNGVNHHLCSRRKNYKDCENPILKEKDLLFIIERHCLIHSKDFSIEKLKLFILRIEVFDNEVKILWRDGLISKTSSTELIF